MTSVIRTVQHGYWIIFLCLAGAVGLAVAYILDATPLYTASASILIDPYRSQSALVQIPLSDSPIDVAVVDTQVELIKSEAVARLAIAKLGKAANDLILRNESRSHFAAFKTAVVDWIRASLTHGDEESAPDPTISLITDLESNLYVKRVGLTFVIQVAYQGQTSSGAAAVANAVAEAYLGDQVNSKLAAAQRLSASLSERAAALRSVWLEADRKVQTYQGNDRIVVQQLTSAAQTAKSTYDVFERRAMETQQAGDDVASVARLVSPASAPPNRSWPRSSIILLSALTAGLGFGVLISFARQRFARVYRTASDVEADFGAFIGSLQLNTASLRRKLRRGKLKSANVTAILDDVTSQFADVARRVAVRFDPVAASAERPCVGVLSFGADPAGSLLALRLAIAAAEANRSAMVLEAQPAARVIGQAWALGPEKGLIALGTGAECSRQSKVLGVSLEPHDAVNVTPGRIREFMNVSAEERQITVVSFSVPDFGAAAAWITALDAYVVVIERNRTRRRVIASLLNIPELEEKCVGPVLS